MCDFCKLKPSTLKQHRAKVSPRCMHCMYCVGAVLEISLSSFQTAVVVDFCSVCMAGSSRRVSMQWWQYCLDKTSPKMLSSYPRILQKYFADFHKKTAIFYWLIDWLLNFYYVLQYIDTSLHLKNESMILAPRYVKRHQASYKNV